MRESILVVDDEAGVRSALSGILGDEGYTVEAVESGEDCLATLESRRHDLLLLDVWLPGMDGLETLERGRALEPEVRALKEKVEHRWVMIGESPAIQRLRADIAQAAPSNGRVLVFGENGTGKELVARNIHAQSLRANGPFVEVNCAAIPEELIESELFGHTRGAFTGALTAKKGKFELADGGTLFLDEVGDMTLKTQAKVLRVLQEQRLEPVGGTGSVTVDVRVIAATNKNLEEEIRRGAFREDLYFRLNVIPFQVP